MDFIDLHIHTTASDGTCTPSEVVEMALEKGLYAIAVTDHDTVSGVNEAIGAASGRPLRVVPGVEISSVYNDQEVHVLGLNIDHHNNFLLRTLKHVEEIRTERNEKMCALLREQGFDITLEELSCKASNTTITRGDMGRLMVSKGYVRNINEAFSMYLSAEAVHSCYVPRFKMPLEDVSKLIAFAGGTCSIAHPVQYKLSIEQYRKMFRAARRFGIGCVEAIHSDNGVNDEEKFTSLAREEGLKITGGSDFHGQSKPGISIGTGRGNIMVPKALLRNIGIFDI